MKIKDIILSKENRDKFNISMSGDVVIPGFVTDPDTGELCRIAALSSDLFCTDTDYMRISGSNELKHKITSIIVPPTVTDIPDGCFASFFNLSKIILPDNVKTIGNRAFLLCDSLVDVKLPETLEEIGTRAFQSCRKLNSIDIPRNIKKIGGYAFSECYKLEDVEVPSTVEYVGEAAFCYVPHIYYRGDLPDAPWFAQSMN